MATDPKTGRAPENWHQRLSELRTDKGYTILSWRNRGNLKVSEYMMPNAERRSTASRRTRPNAATWKLVLDYHDNKCAWSEAGFTCGLRMGDQDPVGGGTVKLTPDHKTPHAIHAAADPKDPTKWQPLCGRHQVMKKNYWDDESGDSPACIGRTEARGARLSQGVLWRWGLSLAGAATVENGAGMPMGRAGSVGRVVQAHDALSTPPPAAGTPTSRRRAPAVARPVPPCLARGRRCRRCP